MSDAPPRHVVVATDLTDDALAALRAAPGVRVSVRPPRLDGLHDALHDADAIITRDDLAVGNLLLSSAPRLRVVGRLGASLGGLDLDALTVRGIMVTHTPASNAVAAAEHTLLLILALCRRLVTTHNALANGYVLTDRRRQAGTQLIGKTLGLVGYGRVGRAVAQRALAFGMMVLAYDPYLAEDAVDDPRVTLVGLRELLERSDVLSLHVPTTPDTHHMLNAERIAQLRPGARVVNTASAHAWDEQAVVAALRSGHLAGVGVDVFADEPFTASPLVGVDGVVHTPHIADNTVETTEDASLHIVHQVIGALHGDDYVNVVNLPFPTTMPYDALRPYLLLAERIGMMQHVLARTPVRRVIVEARGDTPSGLIKPLTAALLKGLLAARLGAHVTLVNAPLLAEEQGLAVAQAKNLADTAYSQVFACEVTWGDGTTVVIAGALLDGRVPQIVQIDRYALNVVPEGHLLIMGSYDQPGVIGKVGTLLADNAVNIATWTTGRTTQGGHTLTVLTLDQPLPATVLDQLRTQDFVRHATPLAL